VLTSYWPAGDLSFIDIFCGAGGSSQGLREAGYSLRLAANHWRRAIETHQANFVDADHFCGDVNGYDMRRLPPARILWASTICTEGSPAGGTVKYRRNGASRPLPELGVLTEEDKEERRRVENAGWERTRATAYDVLRATEVWSYDVVIVENVLEFAKDWPLFWWWLDGMKILGYRHHIVSVNSAHIGDETNPHAPQWRDRIYIVFVKDGIAMPDLEPRPLAHCFDCGEDVAARQTWKDTDLTRKMGPIGCYREQYVYTCPNTARRHERPVVEPFVLPAASAIFWDDLGPRIGDRKPTKTKPEGLAPATMRKIRAGIALINDGPTVVQVNHTGHDGRHYSAWDSALAARTSKGGDGLACPPMLVQVGGNRRNPHPVDVPMATRMTRETDALVTPAYIVELRGGGSEVRPVDHPLATVSAQGNHHGLVVPDDRIAWGDRHGLVIPYRNGAPKTTATPLHTVATVESAALVRPEREVDIREFRLRMLKAREHLRAQRFPDSYIVTGTSTEQTMQAGNAVSSNVAHWIGRKVAAVLA
jgi:DNA (cytosine-5)-methyltransferase 1